MCTPSAYAYLTTATHLVASPFGQTLGPRGCTAAPGAGAKRVAGAAAATMQPHVKIAPSEDRKAAHTMDIEHINAIGNSLADLTQRTLALRGYL
jgi:hypothetical protein